MHGIIYCLQQLTPGDNSPEMLLVIHHRQEGLVDQQVKVLLHVKGIGNRRGIRLHTLAYNLFPEEDDEIIRRDTEEYMRDLLKREYPEVEFVVVPFLDTK